jgi:acetyltransferase-like isoleucine patch superfamily enzyme
VTPHALLRSFARYAFRYRSVNGAWLAVKYPRVHIARGANLDIEGVFRYGAGCSIGTGANVIVPQGARLTLGENCYIGRHVELAPGGNVNIGDDTSIQDRSIFLGDVTIGRYCTIAPNVYVSSGTHFFDIRPHALIKDQDRHASQNGAAIEGSSHKIVVEDDCWLGINTVLMPGIVVGKGSVVGANSVVTRDVDPYTVVAGGPARVIGQRLRFSPPSRISWDNPLDWPYFYAGFEMSQRVIDIYTDHGGIAAKSNFVLCLDSTEGDSLHVIAKAVGASASALTFGSQRRDLLTEFRELTFGVDSCAKTTMRYPLRAEPADVTLIVREAWIQ